MGNPTDEIRAMLDERGIERKSETDCDTYWYGQDGTFYKFTEYSDGTTSFGTCQWNLTPVQAIAATVGKGKAKAHPLGYESDTGFFDTTRCECGEMNDISARYCNQCGREIQLDMSVIEYAEDWYTPQHVCKVNADGTLTSLRNGKTYVDAATVGAGTCHMEVKDNLAETEGMGEVWLECDRCHWQMMLEPTTPRFKHCPNCKRRVVSE